MTLQDRGWNGRLNAALGAACLALLAAVAWQGSRRWLAERAEAARIVAEEDAARQVAAATRQHRIATELLVGPQHAIKPEVPPGMSSEGPNYPSVTSDAGSDWSPDPSALGSEDPPQAATYGPLAPSSLLKATGFDWTTPGPAPNDTDVIDGIFVEINRIDALAGGGTFDYEVTLLVAGSPSGSNYADTGTAWPTGGYGRPGYGGATDKWGLSLTGADVKNSGFGVGLRITADSSSSASVESIRVTIYWSSGGGGGGEGNGGSGWVPEGMLGAHGGGLPAGLNSQAFQNLLDRSGTVIYQRAFPGAPPARPIAATLSAAQGEAQTILSNAPGASIFRAGFAATPVGTPTNPHPLVISPPAGYELLVNEAFAGSARVLGGFEGALAPLPQYPVIVGRPDQDVWPMLLEGRYLSRQGIPQDPLPATQPYTVQVLGYVPGVGVPFEWLAGSSIFARGSLAPDASLPSHVAAWSAEPFLSTGLLAGSVISHHANLEAGSPTFAPPPAHIAAQETLAELIDVRAGQYLYSHGFAAALPVLPQLPVVVSWPQGVELERDHGGAVIAAHGFADAFPVLPPVPAVITLADQQAALLTGAVISFQTDVTPQPAFPQPAHLAHLTHNANELELLPLGAVISARGFAGAQPSSPQPGYVAAPPLSAEFQSLLSGDVIASHGFATGRLPEAPPQYLIAFPPDLMQLASLLEGSSIYLRGEVLGQAVSPLAAVMVSAEPPPVEALAGVVRHGRGTPPDRYDAPTATTWVVAARGLEQLTPQGSALFAHGFAGAQPDSPQWAVISAAPVGVELQQSLLAGAVLTSRGFARGLESPAPAPYVVSVDPPPVEALAGAVLTARGFAPAHAGEGSRLYVAAAEPLPAELLFGDVVRLHGTAPEHDAAPPQTVLVAVRSGDDLLCPEGRVISGRGFAGAQPAGPQASIVASEPVSALEQALLARGQVIAARGFALALPDARPNVLVCSTEPPPLAALAGDVLSHHALIEAPAPSHASAAAVISQPVEDYSLFEGRAQHHAGRVAPQPAIAPRPFVLVAANEEALFGACGGAVVFNARASLAPPRECSC